MSQEWIGQSIDRYNVVEFLADELWGSIYKGLDPRYNRSVALHILDPEWAGRDEQGDYLFQVAQAALRWRHTGIAHIYDVLQQHTPQVVVGELIPGHDLARMLLSLRRDGRWIDLSEAVNLVGEIAMALGYVHPRGIVHGNISPSCIAFRPQVSQDLPYQPVLTGLGYVRPDQALAQIPDSPYRSPEAKSKGRLGAGDDLYALGMILYELVTGQLSTEDPISPVRRLRSDLPEVLEGFLLTALNSDPAQRFNDAGQFASALADLQPAVGAVDSAPVGFQEAISLLPIIERSIQEKPLRNTAQISTATVPERPTASSTAATPTTPVSGDQVHLLTPEGDVLSYAITKQSLTFGRGSESDITIDRPGISRKHARLLFEDNQYWISDLKSTNGTFLDQDQLPSETPTVWNPGENVRIGDVWLRLERGGQGSTTQVGSGAAVTRPARPLQHTMPAFTSADGSLIDTSLVHLSPGGSVGIYTDTPNISVTPGSGASLNLQLFNRAEQPDVLTVTFEGIPEDWISNPPHPIGIPANGARLAQITFRPPRTSAGRAGRHNLIVRAASQRDASQAVELRVTLTVTAFSQFFSELQPKTVYTSQIGQVMIHNRGNLPETFTVLFEDRYHDLVFDPPEMRLTVPPGKSAAVEYRPGLARPRWFGGESQHAFKVHVSAQTGQMVSHSGEYFAKGLIPVWAPVVLAFLCVVFACGMIILLNQVTAPSRSMRRTQEAQQTAMVIATQQAAQIAMQTATAQAVYIQGTQTAAAATATWSVQDLDQDGLSNAQEAQAGTLPNSPDTDNDQLNDGDEVNTWKTNPLNPDTDADTLLDGKEVQIQTNPLSPDTDGDGLNDAVDPDPRVPSTRTPVVVYTFTPPVSVTPPVPSGQIDLAVSITNGRIESPTGAQVTYTILVSNKTAVPVANVLASVSVPPNLANPTWNCVSSTGSACRVPNGTGSINVRLDLAPYGNATFTLGGIVGQSSLKQLVVTATANPPAGVKEVYPTDNQATDVDSLPVSAQLSLGVTDNREGIQPGQPTGYQIVISNQGPGAVNGVTVVDNFPLELQDISWTCTATAGSACQIPAGNGNINMLLNLTPGGAVTILANAVLRPDAVPGTLANTVSIASPVDPAQNNLTATDTTGIVPPIITPSTITPTFTVEVPTSTSTLEAPTETFTPAPPTADPRTDLLVLVTNPPTVTVGATFTYTLDILNQGPGVATNLALVDQLPDGATFILHSLIPNDPALVCIPVPGRVTCNLGSLAPGGKITIYIVLTAPAVPGEFYNTADIKGTEVDLEPSNNTVTTTITVY